MITLIDKLNKKIAEEPYFLDENGEVIIEKVKTAAINLDDKLLSILLSDDYLLYENSLYLEHIPRKLEDRFFIDKTSMSKIAAAFESEFSACYSNETCFSEKKNQAIEKVTNEINDRILTSTGRVKDIYKTLLKSINHIPLSAKIEFALNSNETSLAEIKKYIRCNLKNKEVASICANYRNDIDHGNKIFDFKDGTGEAFVILNCLIYSLQLKRANYSEEEINVMLPMLYHCN